MDISIKDNKNIISNSPTVLVELSRCWVPWYKYSSTWRLMSEMQRDIRIKKRISIKERAMVPAPIMINFRLYKVKNPDSSIILPLRDISEGVSCV